MTKKAIVKSENDLLVSPWESKGEIGLDPDNEGRFVFQCHKCGAFTYNSVACPNCTPFAVLQEGEMEWVYYVNWVGKQVLTLAQSLCAMIDSQLEFVTNSHVEIVGLDIYLWFTDLNGAQKKFKFREGMLHPRRAIERAFWTQTVIYSQKHLCW